MRGHPASWWWSSSRWRWCIPPSSSGTTTTKHPWQTWSHCCLPPRWWCLGSTTHKPYTAILATNTPMSIVSWDNNPTHQTTYITPQNSHSGSNFQQSVVRNIVPVTRDILLMFINFKVSNGQYCSQCLDKQDVMQKCRVSTLMKLKVNSCGCLLFCFILCEDTTL